MTKGKISLGFEQKPGESPAEAMRRQAKALGVETEVEADYQLGVSRGETEMEAAWSALYEWDALDVYIDDVKCDVKLGAVKPTQPQGEA